ncbi:MAG: hypothetical protein HY922_08235 [Elusimicrobia bacterium]|nr:hypothetical protein [Elusimicrobiota bacterium]
MLRKVLAVSIVVLMASGWAAAADIDFDQGKLEVEQFLNPAQLGASVVIAPEKAGAAKAWTIMVYVNAKNNLESFGLADVNEMEAVGSTSKVNVVVELGRLGSDDGKEPVWRGHRRYLVKKDGDPSKITSPVVMDIPKADMGDYRHLVEFGQWAKENYPASRYMLIVWNHGSGWNLAKNAGFKPKGISYDDETNNHITTQQLAQALAALGKTDVYGSDACLMQMASVDYEMKGAVDVIVGSEQTEPGEGYDYTGFLKLATANPGSAEDIAVAAVKAYHDFYAKRGESTTQSALRASALSGLLSLAGEFGDAAMAAKETALVKNAKKQAVYFTESDNRDLYHFVQLVVAGSKNSAVKEKGQALLNFIANDLMVANAPTGSEYEQNAHGLAIYTPQSGYSSAYDKLAWARDGKWDEFMKWTLKSADGGSDDPSPAPPPDDGSDDPYPYPDEMK